MNIVSDEEKSFHQSSSYKSSFIVDYR